MKTNLHYQGIVNGDPSSVVAISIFENELMGLISSDKLGNLVLGKVQGVQKSTNKHVLYPDKEILKTLKKSCQVLEIDKSHFDEEANSSSNRTLDKCVRLYLEVDEDIFLSSGGGYFGLISTVLYVTGLLNQVNVLFNNEAIDLLLSDLKVWTSSSPYPSSDMADIMDEFENQLNLLGDYNGDIAHLLTYKSGGGVANLNVLCVGSKSLRTGISSIESSYEEVPTYSYSVFLVAHEIGHNLGSQHTQSCTWNGNNTAIDGCAPVENGNCPLPPIPSDGGTIMSYCDAQNVGINFNKGFGPQPGNLIRDRVGNAPCLFSQCILPTCTDGILNNGEVLVDCGGPNCVSCPCNNNLQLVLVTDNFANDISWEIVSSVGLIWASSNGSYPHSNSNSTITENFCVPDGCYTLNVLDSNGDGICCNSGNGYYNLVNIDSGETLYTSNGMYGALGSSTFCLGNVCEAGYVNASNDEPIVEYIDRVKITQFSSPTVIPIDKNYSGNGSGGYQNFMDPSIDMMIDDPFLINGWVQDFTLGYDFHDYTFDIWFDLNQNGQFEHSQGELYYRKNGNSSSPTLHRYVPDIANTINGEMAMRFVYRTAYSPFFGTLDPCVGFPNGQGEAEDYMLNFSSGTPPSPLPLIKSESMRSYLNAFPNPVNGTLSINYQLQYDEGAQIKIIDLTGRIQYVKSVFTKPGFSQSDEIDIGSSGLAAGIYLLSIEGATEKIHKRIVVITTP